jgi:hypothetical protein
VSFDPSALYDLVRSAVTPADDPEHEVVDVSVHFFTVHVNRNGAEAVRSLLVEILDEYPEVDQFGNEQGGVENLRAGLSYIALGSAVGSQELALMLMAVGEVCGFWKVITPEVLGMTGEAADNLAGRGMVMCDGYRP